MQHQTGYEPQHAASDSGNDWTGYTTSAGIAFGAPDVGLTQLLVETLTLIIAAIVLLRLPPIEARHRPGISRMALSLLLAVLGLGGGVNSKNQEGADLYREGKLDEALAAFTEAHKDRIGRGYYRGTRS